jgi:hypothetical protein
MQETECLLREGEYWNLVLEMRRNGEVERVDAGPLSKSSQFRVNPHPPSRLF